MHQHDNFMETSKLLAAVGRFGEAGLAGASQRLASVITWAAAAGVTTSLHVGAYLVATSSETPAPPPIEAALAAINVDLDPISVASQSLLDNASDGPEQDAMQAVAAQQVTEAPPPPTPPEEKIPELPPTPADAQSDALLPEPPPKAAELPPKEEKQEAKLETPPEPKPEDSEKKDEVKEQVPEQAEVKAGGGPKSNAPKVVSSLNNPVWLAGVRTRIVRAKQYPAKARMAGQTGEALVSVTINGKGQLEGATLLIPSGVPSLDEEAVAVMRRAAPYPPPPGGETVTLRIPISFSRL